VVAVVVGAGVLVVALVAGLGRVGCRARRVGGLACCVAALLLLLAQRLDDRGLGLGELMRTCWPSTTMSTAASAADAAAEAAFAATSACAVAWAAAALAWPAAVFDCASALACAAEAAVAARAAALAAEAAAAATSAGSSSVLMWMPLPPNEMFTPRLRTLWSFVLTTMPGRLMLTDFESALAWGFSGFSGSSGFSGLSGLSTIGAAGADGAAGAGIARSRPPLRCCTESTTVS